MKKLFTVMLMCGALAFGQQPKSPAKKASPQAKAPADRPLPISHYMQKMGLLYLDDVDKMIEQATRDFGAPDVSADPEENIYGKALTNLEDNIEIDIKLPGDKKFLDLLEEIKTYAVIATNQAFINGYHQVKEPDYKPVHSEFAKMYPVCAAHAHDIIRAAAFTWGDCSQAKVKEAGEIDKQRQEKQSEAKP